MAAPSRRTTTSVMERLYDSASSFEFTQAVRILQRIGAVVESQKTSRQHANDNGSNAQATQPVGQDTFPNREVIRFRSALSHTFPASEIVRVSRRGHGALFQADETIENEDDDMLAYDRSVPHDVSVAFLGLIGPSGALPLHYTSALIERERERDTATRDFLDLFLHRLASFFYRATEKHCIPLRFERDILRGRKHNDVFSQCLWSIVGLGTGGVRDRLNVNDQSALYFSGHYARGTRSTVALEGVLSERFHLAASIEQFRGQWLPLPADGRSSLADTPGSCNALGQELISGEWVWDVQSRFRIRLGPLRLKRFIDFTPAGRALQDLWTLVRLYVGYEFDFEVQPILHYEDIPTTQLGGDPTSANGARLGWTTWLRSKEEQPDSHFDGAVFEIDDLDRV